MTPTRETLEHALALARRISGGGWGEPHGIEETARGSVLFWWDRGATYHEIEVVDGSRLETLDLTRPAAGRPAVLTINKLTGAN